VARNVLSMWESAREFCLACKKKKKEVDIWGKKERKDFTFDWTKKAKSLRERPGASSGKPLGVNILRNTIGAGGESESGQKGGGDGAKNDDVRKVRGERGKHYETSARKNSRGKNKKKDRLRVAAKRRR